MSISIERRKLLTANDCYSCRYGKQTGPQHYQCWGSGGSECEYRPRQELLDELDRREFEKTST